jgi:16S rRNA (cytosine1402-N4)-methyltransferase
VRIAVNDELGVLERTLPRLRDRLTPDGVIAIISYHSGEDRLVKHAFIEWSASCICPPKQPACTCRGEALGKTVTRKPIRPTAEESEQNPRARSALLRAWRRAA